MSVTDLRTHTAAPSANRADRWQPTRAGLIGVWRYWDETFTFHKGRLLLRGPNGSGKSMALELLLPFVLDADASPNRLTSAAKSRGGLYERIMAGGDDSTRAGFAWVEFARGDDVFTAGVRLRASASTRRVDTDFFTTTQAVGDNLHLLDERREPLSRKDLIAALGTAGRMHDSREEHRAAVRATLFTGFGADRYESVLTALLALRKEKLSQNLDLAKLSEVLTEALPPIDDHDLAAVAEGFERLDRRRDELAALERELEAVRALNGRQRTYSRAVLARVAGAVRSAESQRDKVTREHREATEALETARADLETVLSDLENGESRIAEIEDTVSGLKSSAAYKEGAQLDDLKGELEHLQQAAARAEDDLRHAQEAVGDAVGELERAEQGQAATAGNLDAAVRELRSRAATAGAEPVIDEAATIDDTDDALRLVAAWLTARRRLIGEVRAALAHHNEAVGQRGYAETLVAADEMTVEERAAARRAAEVAVTAAATAFGAACETWSSGCDAIGPDRVRGALLSVDRHPLAVTAAVAALAADLQTEQAVARRVLDEQHAAAVDARAALQDERALIAEGGLADPPPPPWRGDRTRRAGAPLWQLVDVPDGAGVDGLEASLFAAGLLDAWVGPDGDLTTPDLVLVPRPLEGPTLADHLVVLPDTAVLGNVTESVLRSIPVRPTARPSIEGEPDVVVGLDGSFRLGAAVGRGATGPASLLGAAARERHRLRRLAELDAAIDLAGREIAAIVRERDAFERTVAAVAADLAAVPSGRAVLDAEQQEHDASARLAEAVTHLDSSRERLRAAEDGVRAALRALTATAARHGLPSNDDALALVEAVLTDLERSAQTWARRRQDHSHKVDAVSSATAARGRAEGAARRAADVATRAAEQAGSLRRRVETIEGAIGAEYAAVVAQVRTLTAEQQTTQARVKQLRNVRSDLDRRMGGLQQKVTETDVQRTTADAERHASHQRFSAAVAAGFPDDAGLATPPPLDGITAVLEAARVTGSAVGEPDAAAEERSSSRVDEALHQARTVLRGRVDLYRDLAKDGWWVLRAAATGLRRQIALQADAMAAELDAGRAELDADEEHLFEQVLAGSVRRALAERIRLANHLVDGINVQLAKVRTQAGGVSVRLRWDVDPDQPDAVRAARALLLRDPADLSDVETASLQAFVRARVEQARIELEANAPWEARLRETLDYRAWHRFTLQIGHRDWEGHRPASTKMLQRLSTGERSIALHLPMLASIAAHYTGPGGGPSECPRLILLDELFAGVDTANRAQLFGTFTDWDLDAVFTSDHEWCQYGTLDGIAIHHLHPPTRDEPVTSTGFVWDGHERSILKPG